MSTRPVRAAVVATVALAVAAGIPAATGRADAKVLQDAAPSPATVSAAASTLSQLSGRPGAYDVGTTTLGTGGWRLLSTARTAASGTAVSSPGFDTAGWLKVRPEENGAPGTELNALLQNGGCPHIFYSDTMRQCFGVQKRGQETVKQFVDPWWFRTDFTAPRDGSRAALVLNGVIGEADVWVNGVQVSTRATVQGAYTRYSFDVTSLLLRGAGRNTLAIKMYPNNPRTMFTVTDLDWSQIPPDQDTGIQFPVQLVSSDGLSMDDAHVTQSDAADLSSADLTVKAAVTNSTDNPRRATVAALVAAPDHRTRPVVVAKSVTVGPHTTLPVAITSADDRALHLRHPAVWWPYQLGAQPLYTVVTALVDGRRLVASDTQHVGIRTVSSRLVGANALAPHGSRQYVVNGRPVVIRGGGFQPDLFVRYEARDTAQQIRILKAMGLNTLRLEGHFMPADFYDQMDRAGILIASGYSCCDAWELDPDTPLTPKQVDVLKLSATTLAQNQRSHPSVFTFQWSDNNPTPPQETATLDAFKAEDFTVPLLASAEYKSTPRLGWSGEKEGPYDWVPPDYWYDRSHYDADDDSRTNVGGAWALDTEQSAGHTVPMRDSMDRFLSPADQHALWTEPATNQYHANPETGTTGYAFGTLFTFDTALKARYGSWSSLDEFTKLAQLQNYEDVRAQFEAFIAHSADSSSPSTGTIYWQANKGWPTLLWALYNDDFDQAGSYFGAQEANRSLHTFFATDSGAVGIDNLTGSDVRGLAVHARVVTTGGNVVDDRTIGGLRLASQQVRTGLATLKVPKATVADRPATTYLVELTMTRDGKVVDRNTYWRSTRPDVVDWAKTMGNPQATMTQYADLTALRSLPSVGTRVSAHTTRHGSTATTSITFTNTSRTTTDLFVRADVRRGTASGHRLGGDDQVTYATWDRNDLSLGAGQRQTITATYPVSDLRGARPVVTISGLNTAPQTVRA